MQPISMPHNNCVFHPPSNWNSDEYGVCTSLHVSNYDGVLYSYFKPSWKEKLLILFGKPVRLCVSGSIQPPVALDCES